MEYECVSLVEKSKDGGIANTLSFPQKKGLNMSLQHNETIIMSQELKSETWKVIPLQAQEKWSRSPHINLINEENMGKLLVTTSQATTQLWQEACDLETQS